MASVKNTLIILMALRPRDQYHAAAEALDMVVVTLDPPDVIQNITGERSLAAINTALHRASLTCLREVEKGRPILLDFCPIRTIAVEGKCALYAGGLTDQDISQYKDEWGERWLPALKEAGYSNIVVLADVADVDISSKVQAVTY